MQNTLVLCAIVAFFVWYYHTKLKEIQSQYYVLHRRFDEVCNENGKLKSRVKDLQAYKNDVSKTFKILDNELVMINEHIKKNNPRTDANRAQPANRISILSPNLLNSLMNAEQVVTPQNDSQEHVRNILRQDPVIASFTYDFTYNPTPSVPQQETEEHNEEELEHIGGLPNAQNFQYEKFSIETE